MTRKQPKTPTTTKARHRVAEAQKKLQASRDGVTAAKREKTWQKAFWTEKKTGR